MTILDSGSERVSLAEIAQDASRIVADAIDRLIAEYKRKLLEGEREDEPALTARLVQTIKDALHYHELHNVHWNTTILKSGRTSKLNERKVGADVLIHLKIETPYETVSKGILIQAKRKEQHERLSSQDVSDLEFQCKNLRRHSDQSFILEFQSTGIKLGPALDWLATKPRQLNVICKEAARDFFEGFFACRIGDRNITSDRVNLLPITHKIELKVEGDISEVDG